MKTPPGTRLAGTPFFRRDTVEVARDLLGHLIYAEKNGRLLGGRIVETEAYLYRDDPACHASRGMTERNRVMFEPGGVLYVYFIYGMYYCINLVTGPEGEGTAVLVRAIEPLEGIDVMRRNRKKASRDIDLANGPGKLAQAFGITLEDNGTDLARGHIRVYLDKKYIASRPAIICTTRVGIKHAAERPLRFYIKGSPWISRK